MRDYLAVRPALPSFMSEQADLRVDEWIPAGQPSRVGRAGPDVVGMARWAMRYLVHNPQAPRGHECRFGISPLALPPAPADDAHDPVSPGDTESRMELEYAYMRDVSGITAGQHVEGAIRARLVSYVREDGLCWCSPYCLGEPDPTPAAMTWTTGHLLRSTAERLRRTGDEGHHRLCRRLFEGLRRLADRRGDLAWYEGGLAAWRGGEWLSACRDHYPSVVDPLVRYWEVSGEADVLAFAEEMAEGIVQGVQQGLAGSRVQPDGSHRSGNCHLVMRAALGVAEVGVRTHNARLVEWARRVYEYTRANGTDWGWYPENIKTLDKRYCSETCVTGDMVECAVALAQAGYPEYWDHVERAVRNYLPEAQFFLTPRFVALYRQTHAQRPEEAEAGLCLLRTFEGGFLARQRPNDWVYQRAGRWQVNMMGCCPPEGMRALYAAWAHTVVEGEGQVVVNLALDRDAAAARVTTLAPQQGTLRVEARRPAVYRLRPPSWAPREAVRASVNDTEVAPRWQRGYVCFADLGPGDTVRLDYPLPVFTQRIAIGCDRAEEVFQVRWVGNDVEEVSPAGRFLPVFAGQRRALPPLLDEEAADDTVTRPGPGAGVGAIDDWRPE
ncbi:MAG: hypothetical protein AB1505_13975 [Candidatus Latescibacterota bacterium]